MWCLKKGEEGAEIGAAGAANRAAKAPKEAQEQRRFGRAPAKIGAIQWGPRPDGFPSRRRPSNKC